jgi:polysaccharide export outer membrane protein
MTGRWSTRCAALLAGLLAGTALPAQLPPGGTPRAPRVEEPFQGETTEDYNRRLAQLRELLAGRGAGIHPNEYRIGPEDLLEMTVFDAPELNRTLRVSAGGEISMPLLGPVTAAGLTPRELEFVLQELLRRSFMKDPHVGVFVREMQSHPVSVIGAVRRPGVFQLRGTKSLVEILSMAEGLADDAGDTVVVVRGAQRGHSRPAEGAAGEEARRGPAGADGALEIPLKSLLESGAPEHNVAVHPGDVVKVSRAGIVYVVGEVRKPGGFVLRNNEKISALQALALAEGLTRTSAKSQARIIRTDELTGQRTEVPLDLGKVLAGKKSDPVLQPRDIVFVPNSTSRTALYRGAEAAISIVTGVVIWRR